MRLLRSEKPKGLGWFMLTRPMAATGPQWDRINRYQQFRFPFRVFLQRTLPVWLKVRRRRVRDMIWWVRYRTTDRNHVIKVTSVKPGYLDTDALMLHVNFDLLVKHVVVGLGSKNWKWHEARIPKWVPKLLSSYWPSDNGPAAGLSYLHWEMTDPDVKLRSPDQAEQAAIIKRLYDWWTVERPARSETHSDPRIWDGVERKQHGLIMFSDQTQRMKVALETMRQTQLFYDEQDQAMLELLIEIRPGLWS